MHLVLDFGVPQPRHAAAGQTAYIVKAVKQRLTVLDVLKGMFHCKNVPSLLLL